MFCLLGGALAGTAFGAEAVIEGPSEALKGQMIVLNGGQSEGDAFFWIPDPTLNNQNIQCGSQFATSIIKDGVYYFYYVAMDITEDVTIAHDYAVHTITVGNPTAPTPPPPTDDLLTAIEQISRKGARELNDNPTTVSMAAALNGVTPKATVEATAKSVVAAIDGVLLRRVPTSRGKDWLNAWRVPLNEAFDTYNPETVADLMKAIKAASRGLVSSPTLIAHVTNNCVHCDAWKNTVYNPLRASGQAVLMINSSDRTEGYPFFEIINDGKLTTLIGTQDLATLQEALQ